MKRVFFVFGALIFFVQLSFASVDTVFVYSNAMHRLVKTIVIKPSEYKSSEKRFPVLYLLHGAGGNSANLITRLPMLDSMATLYNMILVCADGSPDSWYFDSPVDSNFKYETHIGKELPEYVDDNYRTVADRKHRAIAGISMGGHGAFFLAFRHADIFGACGSISGALDMSSIKSKYNIEKRLGDTIKNLHYYNDWSGLKVVEKYPKDSLAIIFDCGVDDPFIETNRAVHRKLLKNKIPHDYTERPGAHNWIYWANAVKYQLLFFHDFFERR